jgi:hypothetical protein
MFNMEVPQKNNHGILHAEVAIELMQTTTHVTTNLAPNNDK